MIAPIPQPPSPPGEGGHHFVIGTAGHVDHGKTRLIQALTGVDCDRLAEEKRRGLTIELGFAPLRLPSGQTLGVVDVPGHEHFLKNMLAGAHGIDFALLVIAADEGIKPQTIEHLYILDSLKTKGGLVVLTKCDREEKEGLRAEIETLCRGTFLEGAIVIPVSAETGEGIEGLRAMIEQALEKIPPRDSVKPFRLAVDRVFTQRGFGTVVTGTLLSGKIEQNDEIELFPQGIRSRVRGIQVHGEKKQEAFAGQRIALNLPVDHTKLERGSWIAQPDSLRCSEVWDCRIEAMKKIEHRTRVRVHHGSAEEMARLFLREDEVPPGEAAYAQLVFERPVAADFQDRLLFFSPQAFLGGGQLLCPAQKRRRKEWDLPLLEYYFLGEYGKARERLLKGGHDLKSIRDLLPHEDSAKEQALLLALSELPAWRTGWTLEELTERLKLSRAALLSELEEIEKAGKARRLGKRWQKAGHSFCLEGRFLNYQNRVLEALSAQPFVARDQLSGDFPEAIMILEERIECGEIIEFGDLCASSEVIERAKETIKKNAAGPFTASQAREWLETNRKTIIPLLEYFDRTGFTRRDEDRRFLK